MPRKSKENEVRPSSSRRVQSTVNNEARSTSSNDPQSTVRNEKRPRSQSRPSSRLNNEARSTTSNRQQLTLYDAIAGRATYEGVLSHPQPPRNANRDTTSHSLTPIPAEEVLFRLEGAPVRYEENDIYFADRHLDQRNELQRLPDSDLSKALHAYVSDFYAAIGDGVDFVSLDETALLALGILVEEAAGGVWSDGEVDEERVDESESEDSDEENALTSQTLTAPTTQTLSVPTTQKPSQGVKVEATSAETSQTLSASVKLELYESADAKLPIVTGRANRVIPDSHDSGSPVRRVMKVESQPFNRDIEMGEGGGGFEV